MYQQQKATAAAAEAIESPASSAVDLALLWASPLLRVDTTGRSSLLQRVEYEQEWTLLRDSLEATEDFDAKVEEVIKVLKR